MTNYAARLALPRWDTAWEIRRRKGRTVRVRPVWDTLNLNARPHWSALSKASVEVFDAVYLTARSVGLHRYRAAHLRVEFVWSPGDHRRADAINYSRLTKVAADALASGSRDRPGLGIVPDDTDRWCTQTTRIARPPMPAGIWLDVFLTDPQRRTS